MIAALSGVLLSKTPSIVILDVRGVGYEVQISGRTYDGLPETGTDVFFHVYTSVREDAITLFGFLEPEEKDLFLLLKTVSGVGPKLSLGILSGIDPYELCDALRIKDIARLTTLSGVGKKTAQRLCVELGEKVSSFSGTETGTGGVDDNVMVQEGSAMHDTASALINLGYPHNVAWQALRALQKDQPAAVASMPVEELIRLALRTLA